ncbi:MAG TPA: hypothetical protein VG893_04800 [Terracidiphilus sp.]|nr:hypothetical protein [Terracidiphilus sp.]
MTAIESWVLSYLLNALWQVPLVFAAAWLAARLMRPVSVAAEHRVWVSALLAQAVLPALSTASWAWLQGLFSLSGGTAARGRVTVIVTEGTAMGALPLPGVLLAAVAFAYGAAVAYFAARLLWQSRRLHALRVEAVEFTPEGEAAESWQRCCAWMATETARIAVSGKVKGPVTIGLRRKILLLPAAMAHALSGAENADRVRTRAGAHAAQRLCEKPCIRAHQHSGAISSRLLAGARARDRDA